VVGLIELRCSVCDRRKRSLIGEQGCDLGLCNDCFERLDQLDTDHLDPAFLFAAAIVRNRDSAKLEGVY
jgi:hypothetical protein